MQRIVREMNISETTFVLPPTDRAHAAKLRIFTPVRELPFAGQPTIGTAWVLSTHGIVPKGELDFTLEEGVGPVRVRGTRGQNGTSFSMTHPPLTFADVIKERAELAAALGLTEAHLVADVPARVASDVGGSVRPVLSGTLEDFPA